MDKDLKVGLHIGLFMSMHVGIYICILSNKIVTTKMIDVVIY